VSKDIGAKGNGAKVQIAQKYFLACPKLKLQKKCL
jgi:hypothetical protein